VPMDWIVIFYYVWGLTLLLDWARTALASSPTPERAGPSPSASAPLTVRAAIRDSSPAFLVLFGVSALMIGLSMILPKRYEVQPAAQMLEDFVKNGYHVKAGIQAADLEGFLSGEGAGAWSGRALYPRYYLAGQGIDAQRSAFEIRDYPRLVFSLVGAQDHLFVILPGAPPKNFPNASDVIVLGCQEPRSDTIEAIAVVVLVDKTYVYAVPPSVALHCPLELKSSAAPQ
ncbi:MAG: hypothetical protein AB1750_10865, partial [Chloroflexota bacterium]